MPSNGNADGENKEKGSADRDVSEDTRGPENINEKSNATKTNGNGVDSEDTGYHYDRRERKLDPGEEKLNVRQKWWQLWYVLLQVLSLFPQCDNQATPTCCTSRPEISR